jgi:hypothetical protein
MPDTFDPDLSVLFETYSPIDNLVSEFRKEFASLITRLQGHMLETADNYLMFNTDYEYKYGTKNIPTYVLSVAGKPSVYTNTAQERQVQFAKKVVAFLEEYGSVELSASFSLLDN